MYGQVNRVNNACRSPRDLDCTKVSREVPPSEEKRVNQRPKLNQIPRIGYESLTFRIGNGTSASRFVVACADAGYRESPPRSMNWADILILCQNTWLHWFHSVNLSGAYQIWLGLFLQTSDLGGLVWYCTDHRFFLPLNSDWADQKA